MTIKHEIILTYTKDLSVETPDAESLISARENISKYSLKLDLNSKFLKNKMVEVETKLTYEDKTNKIPKVSVAKPGKIKSIAAKARVAPEIIS